MAKNYKNVYPNLRDKMVANGMSYRDLAVLLNISAACAYRRLCGKTKFTMSEAMIICHHFNDYDVKTLFARYDD